MADELPTCPRNAPPVVRLALKREKCPRVTREKLSTPSAIVHYLKNEYGCETQEWGVVVGLDVANQVLGIHEVALGGMSGTSVDPKVVFAGLLLMGASAFIFCHNHPSGRTDPSTDDINLTKLLLKAGEILSIRLQDHIIVSGTGFTSFVERGLLR